MKIFLGLVAVAIMAGTITGKKAIDTFQARVVGGTKAPKDIKPTFVSLLIGFQSEVKLCGGYLWQPNYVSTTASCVIE